MSDRQFEFLLSGCAAAMIVGGLLGLWHGMGKEIQRREAAPSDYCRVHPAACDMPEARHAR